MYFQNQRIGVLKVKDKTSNKIFSIPGVNSAIVDPNKTIESAVWQANFLLGIGGLSATANKNAKFEIISEATENG